MKLRAGDWLLVALIAVGTFVLAALGTWQVQRLAWKEAMIERAQTNRTGAPIPYDGLFPLEETGEDLEYRPVEVTGRFLHDREQYYFATYAGTTGRFVYTPLERSDGSFVWVNRGFVPQELANPEKRADGQIEGQVSVVGLAREAPSEKPNGLFPDNEPGKRLFFWKDRDAMTEAAGLDEAMVLPFFVDAAREGPHAAPRYPVGGVTRIEFPNNHLQYAVTWYGLALALLLVGGAFLWRRIRTN